MVVCLGAGIGVNATIFSVVDGVLIQPFPYAEPHRLVVMNTTNREADVDQAGFSYLDLRDWRAQSTRLSFIASSTGRSLTLSDGGEPERYRGGRHLLGSISNIGHSPNNWPAVWTR